MPAELSPEDVRRLQRCANDLLSLLAFPATWAGREPQQIVSSFTEGVLRILCLDMLYVRLTPATGAHLECLRVPHGAQPERDFADPLLTVLGSGAAQLPRQLVLASDSVLSIESLRFGHSGRGVVVAGSLRTEFPLPTERLLLSVAVNQLSLALQETQLRLEQKRVADELDRRVAQRTAELAASNAQLRKEIEDHRQAEAALTLARTELANVARASSLGVLTAAVAHEVNQPISGIVTNANTCCRMLSAQPPNLEGALETTRRTLRDAMRAADVITRLRNLYTRRAVQPELMDLNEAAREVASLSSGELQRNGVIVRHELADGLPAVAGDRIQLQQVILNLLRNASDAMTTIDDRPRELLIRTETVAGELVRLSVRDAGVGLSAAALKRVFDPFYTTKSDGMGIGLSVSRSIIEAHRGNLWATPNDGPGVTFSFSLPLESGGECYRRESAG